MEKTAFSFDDEVKVGDKTVKIADTVSVYSSLSQTFIDLDRALSFYDKFEIYLDKSIDDGGKVRFVVAK
ncbi:hypothetical protein SDC9_157876 [bioreactor metagenome]|uniref:Uncharacterized protein n=1 Tax=bioreactor metagenome TaxID=1076179 RepID=A0A645F8F0_9ZZZZ